MADAWLKCPTECWEVVAELIPTPWPDEACRIDIEHWASRQRAGLPLISRRKLEQRWGRSEWYTRAMMREHLAPVAEPPQRHPSATPAPPQADTVEAAESGTKHHSATPDLSQLPPSRDPFLEEGRTEEEILSAEPTMPQAAPPPEAEPPAAEPPPSKLEGLPPSGRGCKPQWLTAPVLEVYRAWYQHHPEARAIRADQVKAIRGALGQGYTVAQLVAAVRYVHEAPEDMPKVRALREGGYLDLVNTLNGNTRHSNVELGEAWLAGGMTGGKAPAAADTTPRPGPTELELRRWYDLEGGRAVVERIEALGHPKAVGAWRDFMLDDWRRTDDWWRLERWLRADRERRATA